MLRFPEFNEEWKLIKLGSIADIKTGPFGSVLHQHDYVEIGTPIITVEHLDDMGIVHNNLPLVSDEDKIRLKSYILKEGDVVFSRVGSVDRNSLVSFTEDGWLFSGRLLRIRINQGKGNPKYISTIFQKEEYKQKVRSIAVGQTMPSINTEILKSIDLFLPTLPEQQKIAAFLTSVDERIAQLTKKKALLEQYKKGVMQKIFSQEIRFKDDNGKEFGKWEEFKLGELGQTYNGLTGKNKDDFGTGYPFVTYKQIFDNSIIDSSRFEYVSIKNGENQNKVLYGDVFFTTSSETPNEVGFSSVLLDNNDNLYLNSFCFGYRIKSFEVLSPLFASFLFRNRIFRTEVEKLAQGSTRYNMSKTELMKLTVSIPCFEEQTKIANFLSAIDKKIEGVAEVLEATQRWKKGLLQQMFC